LVIRFRSGPPSLSVVVVAYDMARELPRTLRSLAPGYQQGIAADDYEVIVVDNGSPVPVDEAMLAAFPGRVRAVRVDPAPPSPAHAANVGAELARGDFVGLLIDGARMASPGLLAHALLARHVAARPVVATLGWHLGPTLHAHADDTGYDRAAEDRLLAGLDWERDGYRLFTAATLAESSSRGWFAPMGESNALFMEAATWRTLGGLDERFVLPGGGLVNHDFFRRACELEGAQLVVLLGEGTFHQIHGGAATSGRVPWDDMRGEYARLRGRDWKPPRNERLYLGIVPPETLPHVEHAAQRAIDLREKNA
jgi:glycosyltransferase involved in cell wall biosynthesis